MAYIPKATFFKKPGVLQPYPKRLPSAVEKRKRRRLCVEEEDTVAMSRINMLIK
jgi:hypothetical protein